MPSRVIPSFSERAKLYLESDELNETIIIPAMRIDHEGDVTVASVYFISL